MVHGDTKRGGYSEERETGYGEHALDCDLAEAGRKVADRA